MSVSLNCIGSYFSMHCTEPTLFFIAILIFVKTCASSPEEHQQINQEARQAPVLDLVLPKDQYKSGIEKVWMV